MIFFQGKKALLSSLLSRSLHVTSRERHKLAFHPRSSLLSSLSAPTSAEQSVHRQWSPGRRRQTDHRVVDELGRDLDRVSSGWKERLSTINLHARSRPARGCRVKIEEGGTSPWCSPGTWWAKLRKGR
jgi:hypothetical protein